ncbi:hypothetical protein EMIT051CA3_90318 [Pseudomonas chlororaphis]
MAIAANPRDEMIRTRSERGSVIGIEGGALPSGVEAMALVVVMVGSVMKKWHRWVGRESWLGLKLQARPPWSCSSATGCE